MVDFAKLEQDVMAEVRKVVADAEAHEPAIEDAVVQALGAVGAPGAVASAVGAGVGALLEHFRSKPRTA